MTSTSAMPSDNLDYQISVLEMTYPAWHITVRPNGMWTAVRAVMPTLAQAEAGLHRYVIQPTMEALAAVLAQQLAIAQDVRGI